MTVKGVFRTHLERSVKEVRQMTLQGLYPASGRPVTLRMTVTARSLARQGPSVDFSNLSTNNRVQQTIGFNKQ